jgi:hypothetical protein
MSLSGQQSAREYWPSCDRLIPLPFSRTGKGVRSTGTRESTRPSWSSCTPGSPVRDTVNTAGNAVARARRAELVGWPRSDLIMASVSSSGVGSPRPTHPDLPPPPSFPVAFKSCPRNEKAFAVRRRVQLFTLQAGTDAARLLRGWCGVSAQRLDCFALPILACPSASSALRWLGPARGRGTTAFASWVTARCWSNATVRGHRAVKARW